jgi:hypothetical protein
VSQAPIHTIGRSIETLTATLSPLPPEKLALVRTTETDARLTVLEHERATGWPDEEVDYRDGGCVLLAWFEGHPMSYAPNPPPPSAVYIVRLTDEANVEPDIWVIVDATTGELSSTFGGAPVVDCAATVTFPDAD